ncbi:phage baseplate assembly protein domain-containing protein [Acidisoma sp. 7E03]
MTAPSLLRRMVHACGLGRALTAVTDGGPIRRVQLKFMTTAETRDGVRVMQQYGFASRPHANCDFAVVTLDHRPGQSVAVASNDQRYQVPLEEGEAVLHDDQGQVVLIGRDGITLRDKSGNTIVTSPSGTVLTDASGSTVTMAGGGIALTPKNKVVTVAGEIDAQGNGANGMSVDGNLAVTGQVTATGDIVACYGTADQVSVLGHKHQVTAVGSPTSAPIAGS